MKKVGFVGLGDMGAGMAKNILAAGYTVVGFDLNPERALAFREAGGELADSCNHLGSSVDIAFVMVMNGKQAMQVVTDLSETMAKGSTIAITATIHPAEMEDVAKYATDKGLNIIDSPVSGGLAGSQNGTLTLMLAAKSEVLDGNRAVLEAISSNIFHVGEEAGQGQTVKAALQAYIGASFAAIFESLVLGSKAGVSGKVLYDVFGASAVGSPLFKNCAKLIMDRKFEKTGSHIGTMYKDLGISMTMAKDKGVPMFTTSAAYELFQAGKTVYPEGDNWTIVKVLEQLSDTEVNW
ncbi:NAD(P)-dependent oxidoreductase [Photobacterium makurazakiensis]|uniref:NAD(P)-dependent oxidoreductase n=1 Tax=Photobacterium makurazakiensis TaxID=2910234 RepID=UPI003D0B4E00